MFMLYCVDIVPCYVGPCHDDMLCCYGMFSYVTLHYVILY